MLKGKLSHLIWCRSSSTWFDLMSYQLAKDEGVGGGEREGAGGGVERKR